ncbi:MAG: GerMN domain-containing protein [Kineosporiaceae bacterium]
MTTRGRPSGALALAAVAVLAAGCGVPGPGTSRPVPAESVPFGLLSTRSPADPTSPAASARGRVALLDRTGRVVLRPRRIEPGDPAARATAVLAALQQGPGGLEREAGLTSALPPGLGLRLDGLDGGLARVDLLPPADGATPGGQAERWPLALAQLVLSLTSVPEVQRVQVVRAGAPVDVPLPDGRLVSRPVTRADYTALLAPRPTTSSPRASGTS